jgi:apolipoprotein N-acyltransferase
MKNRQIYLLLLGSAVLLSLPFYRYFSGIVLFIAWVPLLFVEDYLTQHKERYRSGRMFLLAWFTFLIWNLLTIYWIWNATIPGAIAAYIINSMIMAVAFWLIHLVHRTLGEKMGHFAFLVIWTAYEHYYLNIQINFPWLLMGNGFAKDIRLVQWYEYTGVLGGTFWVLFINLLIFLLLRHYIRTGTLRDRKFELGLLALLLIVPIGGSLIRYGNVHEEGKAAEIVVVQPNIDPYNDKFSGMSNDEQLSIILHLADSLVTGNTDYVVAPETALNDGIVENDLMRSRSLRRIRAFVREHPRVKFITGATTWRIYPPGPQPTPTARKRRDGSWEDIFNSALQIDTTSVIQIYHKSKLVVGVEMMPHPQLLRPLLGNILIELGGSPGGYGTQKERTPLVSPDSTYRVGVAVCYESIFGDYVTGYVKEGANLLFIITNDGWWGNTPGYHQHRTFASLRAIETRRSIARSANTGISCFIDQKGEASQLTGWWTRDAIRGTLYTNDRITFYTRHGDYFGRVSDFFAIILIFYVITRRLMERKKHRNKIYS